MTTCIINLAFNPNGAVNRANITKDLKLDEHLRTQSRFLKIYGAMVHHQK